MPSSSKNILHPQYDSLKDDKFIDEIKKIAIDQKINSITSMDPNYTLPGTHTWPGNGYAGHTGQWQSPYWGQPTHYWPDSNPWTYEARNHMLQMVELEKRVSDLTVKLDLLSSELFRKNAYIEKLAAALMLILHNPEKIKKLDGLRELYEQYIMVGRLVYGDDFESLVNGLR